MDKVVVLGVGITRFGKHMDKSFKQLSQVAIDRALEDAQIEKSHIEAAVVSNVMAGAIWKQESVRGQVFLAHSGFDGIPIFNVENACASGSTAIKLAQMAIKSGQHDVVLVLGTEKMIHPDRSKVFEAFKGSTDVEAFSESLGSADEGTDQSVFMNLYASEAKEHMEKYGTTVETLAKIAVKNSFNGSLNPYAQYQQANQLETILKSRMISDPLRLLMCSPVSDGAAAAIICSESFAKKIKQKHIYLKSSVIVSGEKKQDGKLDNTTRAAKQAYEQAGVAPKDLGVIEVHDAAVPGELWAYEQLQLCGKGEAGKLIETGETAIDGSIPVNPSGGLIARGHPVGATGIAQLAEVYWQLQGEAGKRQVANQPRVGLTHNVGGYLHGSHGAIAINIISR